MVTKFALTAKIRGFHLPAVSDVSFGHVGRAGAFEQWFVMDLFRKSPFGVAGNQAPTRQELRFVSSVNAHRRRNPGVGMAEARRRMPTSMKPFCCHRQNLFPVYAHVAFAGFLLGPRRGGTVAF